MEDANKITIAQVLDRKRGQAVNNSYVVAASNHLKNLAEEIDTLRKQPLTETTKNAIAQRMALYKAVTAQVYGSSAEAGRALNAHKILAQQLATPREQLISKVLKESKEWGNVDVVVDRLMKFEPNDKMGMMKFLAEVNPSDPIEKIEAVWYNNILSSPSTHLANGIGNLGRTMWYLATKPLRVATDVAVSKVKGGPRQEFLKEWGPELIGAQKGFKDGVRRALFAMKEGFRMSDVEEMRVPKVALKGKVGKAVSVPSRALIAGDELFKGINRSMEIYRQATSKAVQEGLSGNNFSKRVAELINAPDPEMIKRADELSKELLFQKFSSELTAVGGLRDFASFNIPKIGKVKPLQFVIPFVQTPVNVAKFAAEASPIGIATTALQAGKLSQEEITRRMGSALLGTAAMTSLAMYFTEGSITGRAPRSKKEKDAFYAQGKLPYAVKIGDTWVQYNRLPEPLATTLTTLALWHDNFADGGKAPTSEKIQNLAFGYLKGFADRTFLSGIGDLMNALEEPQQYAGNFVKNLATGAIPFSSLFRNVAVAIDPTVRQPETIPEAIKTNIPGLSKTVAAKESAFEEGGVAVRKTPGYQQFLPVKTSKELTNKVANAYLTGLDLRRTRENILELIKQGNKEKAKEIAKESGIKITKSEGIRAIKSQMLELIANGKVDDARRLYKIYNVNVTKKEVEAIKRQNKIEEIYKSLPKSTRQSFVERLRL